MKLADFIESNRDRLVARWAENVVECLSLDLDEAQLRNDLPHFIADLVEALRDPAGHWPHFEGAEQHGRQRMRLGVNIGSLSTEMTLVGATIVELVDESGENIGNDELVRMMIIIGHGAAASVNAYAILRDKQLADLSAQHFSFIAHEIRNPLHNARLAAQALAKIPEAGRPKVLERLERALEQLSDLVDDFLVEARLYSDPQLNIERLLSSDLIDHVCDDLAPQIEDRRLTLSTEVDQFKLDGDRTILLSALTNLLKNAVKFTREGGRIVVRARSQGGRALFEVGDQCGGIAEAFLPRLFQPFVRGRSEEGGSGLGLVIVKQAAEAHGGTVHVDNEPGEGCCFRLDLPRKQGSRTDDPH
ncbi:MAG TPA: HAMP domain-containing sensor histidine kinase [Woeseiaceae bacterium]|nr:HAMP domain-containing sensor histidine kinase [Woeseiaceae bacterium]